MNKLLSRDRHSKQKPRQKPKQKQQKQSEQDLLTTDSIYDFYLQQIYPSLVASLPFLWSRLQLDSVRLANATWHSFVEFLLPKNWNPPIAPPLPEFPRDLLQHLDTNHDGTVSRAELAAHLWPYHPTSASWWVWLSREWPLMDWKIGVFVWQTFGGILLLLTVLSIIPGRLHGLSARILRWPILGLTYFLINVELAVYIVIRLFIRIAEYLIARPKHRKLRAQMRQATSYQEWYKLAAQLDRSQGRDRWLKLVDSNRRYNWGFFRELITDLKSARQQGDSFLALAVLQQCTRKNVGGIMSEDLFSYSNSGEPKYIVAEFVQEVVNTIRWVTNESLKQPPVKEDTVTKEFHEERLQQEVRNEKDKLLKSLLDATLFFVGSSSSEAGSHHSGRSGEESRGGSLSSREMSHTEIRQESHHNDDDSSLGTHDSPTTAADSSSPLRTPLTTLNHAEVLAFMKRARAAYGRTALCLSGGAMMGLYHLGHLAGLLETGTMPNIISGTSAGSAIGALLCTRTDDELKRDLKPEVLSKRLICFEKPWLDRIKTFVKTGHLFTFEDWMSLIKWFTCGDLTFAEAYKKSGRVFCITLSSTTKKAPPVLLNYLTAPNVVVASAVVASAAVPGLIPPVRLQYKDADGTIRGPIRKKEETFFDGSIRQDIPVNGLAEMLNCRFFVACQANPHIVPFFFGNKGNVGRPSRWSSGTQESSWRGGFLLAALEMYLKNDMKAKFRFLNDVEAAVGFTSTLLTQEFVGSTTIVPQVLFSDYFKLFRDPSLDDLYHYFQGGAVAAYEHVAMVKLHYSIADELDECVRLLESGNKGVNVRRRVSVKLPGSRKPLIHVRKEEPLSPPSILKLVMGSTEEQHDCSLTAEDSKEDEYSRDWVDLDS